MSAELTGLYIARASPRTTQRGVARSQRDSKERGRQAKARGRATTALKLGPAEDIILENGNVVTGPMQATDRSGGKTIMQVTRRSLLESGLSASADLVVADNLPFQRDADAAISDSQISPHQSGFEERVEDPVSPREHLLLDFGWRFHLGIPYPCEIEYSASLLLLRSHD